MSFTYRKGDREPIECEPIAFRRSSAVVHNRITGESWPGLELKLRPMSGGRAFWTDAFPDRDGITAGFDPDVAVPWFVYDRLVAALGVTPA